MNRSQSEPITQSLPPGHDDTGPADLDRLAPHLAAVGFRATVQEPRGRLPYLDVRNPRSAAMSEKIYAQADWYFWSWAQRIAPCGQPAAAAAIIARVLRADAEPG